MTESNLELYEIERESSIIRQGKKIGLVVSGRSQINIADTRETRPVFKTQATLQPLSLKLDRGTHRVTRAYVTGKLLKTFLMLS